MDNEMTKTRFARSEIERNRHVHPIEGDSNYHWIREEGDLHSSSVVMQSGSCALVNNYLYKES